MVADRARGRFGTLLLIAVAIGGCARERESGRAGASRDTSGARAGSAGAAFDTSAVADQAAVGAYVVSVTGSTDEPQRARVARGRRTVLEVPAGWRFQILRGGKNSNSEVEPGTDVNGDGIPDVVLQDWSGGAHCCFTLVVVSLGDTARVLETLATGNAGARLVNLDTDPALEVETADDGFAYWPASFAESAAPRVVLDWTAEGLVPSPALTFHAVAEDSVFALATRLRRELEWNDPAARSSSAAQLFQPMADLYFAGHPDIALEFFTRARPEMQREYFDRLLVEFGGILGRSAYWQALERGLAERN